MVIINTRRPPYGEVLPALLRGERRGDVTAINAMPMPIHKRVSANASNAVVRRGCVGLANRPATIPSAALPSPNRQGAGRSGVLRLLGLGGLGVLAVLAKGDLGVSKAEEQCGGSHRMCLPMLLPTGCRSDD